MSAESSFSPNLRMGLIALAIAAVDQWTKHVVLRFLAYGEERIVLEGFFRFVHWGNTGAAWSLFRNNNAVLAGVAVLTLVVLFVNRRHFESHRWQGQLALGLMFGGIIGNLIDRFRVNHVIDFLYFYVHRRGGGEIGFAAFNLADSAICTGVGLLFLISWRRSRAEPPEQPGARNDSYGVKTDYER